jgi:glutathione synthase/RimK-type ligase-like ATP-grasp enzyme
MSRRLLIMGAGGGASNNLIRSLRLGEPSIEIVGSHHNRFTLNQSQADRSYLIPSIDHPAFLESLNALVEKEDIGLLIPNADDDVRGVAAHRGEISCRVFLPRPEVIDLCHDKFQLSAFLRSQGVSVPATCPVTSLEDMEELFEKLAPHAPLWCRLRTGQGGMGAMLVKTPEQARSWIRYWEDMRGISSTTFTLSEYLPGRDFACQALFKAGRLVLIKSYERLTYLGAGAHPAGFSSLAALSKTVFVPDVVEVCVAGVQAIDGDVSGVFCFDVKQNASGVPCLTEINAGRFGLSTSIFDIPGRHNTAITYVRLAFDETVDIADEYDVAEDYYMVRDYDTVPAVVHADELFDGINEVWAGASLV